MLTEFRYMNGNEEKICTFVSHKRDTTKDIYTVRVRYITKKGGLFARKEEKVKTFTIIANKGSVQIDSDDKKEKILDSLMKNGMLELNRSQSEINIGMHNGEIIIKETLSTGPSNVRPYAQNPSNVRTQTPPPSNPRTQPPVQSSVRSQSSVPGDPNGNTTYRNSMRLQTTGNVGNQSIGKHYAMSDIHGMYGSYMDAIRQLKDNDTLYVIGDAIDRGKNGIKILKDIISRQQGGKKPRVIYFLGNHDIQMIKTLEVIRKYGLNIQQIELLKEAGKKCEQKVRYQKYKTKDNTALIQQVSSEIKGILQRLNNIQVDEYTMQTISVWLSEENKGQTALEEYMALSKTDQDKIYQFLTEKASVLGTKKINNKRILFVHAAPPNNQGWVDVVLPFENCGISFKDVPENGKKQILRHCTQCRRGEESGEEWEESFKLWKKAGFFTICGHDPVDGGIRENKENGCICIDSGCGHKKKGAIMQDPTYGCLALYCIDDGKIKYIEPREEERGTVQGGSSGR